MVKNKVMREIESLYLGQNLEYTSTFSKSKAVLNIYRSVVWQVTFSANNMVCESSAKYGKELETALVYLYEFAPEYMKQDFENKVKNLFETKWLIDVIDECLAKIKEYPEYGDDYYSILYYAFLSKDRNTDVCCMSKCKLERTTYYKRKKEAIALMGYMLWGYSLPNLIANIKKDKINMRGELVC